MTLMNIKKKGGDVHGKIPTRIALVLNFRITIRGGQGVTKGFAEGKRTVPGPGKKLLRGAEIPLSLGTSSAISQRAA